VPFYLGFDASTQSLTATLIAVEPDERRIVATRTFRYDDELPHYGTTHGAHHGEVAGVVTSPPLMWAEALDRMLGHLKAAHPRELARVAALGVSAQQHGSVYLNQHAAERLAALDPTVALVAQLTGIFSRPEAPIWLDSSTTAACEALTDAVGGADTLAARTGSRAFERFTGPQIRAWAAEAPAAYAETARIDLVSSFLTSLLIGAPAPLDPGDGSGTNLMDLGTGDWWPRALGATAPDLRAKLPRLAEPHAIAGTLARYWQARYGLPAARVVVGSGDNPSSLVGTGVVSEGLLAISLGTSNTVFGLIPTPTPSRTGEGHVFGAPTGGYMGLTCFSNGSIAREHVRDRFGLSWAGFSDALRRTPPGNDGAVLIPWLGPEITPHVPLGGLVADRLDPQQAAAMVRAVIEGQMMAMANHTSWMGVSVRTIHATGGASANPEILQVMADVFGAEVVPLPVPNSACLGAALRACHADRRAGGETVAWASVIAGLAEPVDAARRRPSAEAAARYSGLRPRYAALEADAIARRAADR
jgi:xylulokinase